jgi:hypothetical protein
MGGPRKKAHEKKAAGVPWRPPWVAIACTVTQTGEDAKSEWKRPKKISRLFELVRRGGGTNVANVDGCPIIASAAQRTTDIIAKGGKAAKSFPQKELALQELECWLLYVYGNVNKAGARMEKLHRFLFAPAAGDPAPEDYEYEPLEKEIVLAYMHMVTAKSTEKFQVQNPKYAGGPEMCGRMCGFSKIEQALNAVKTAEMLICGRTNCNDNMITHFKISQQKADRPESATAYCLERALPDCWEALKSATFKEKSNPFNTGLQRAMIWTMFIMSHVCIARASLFTEFCPAGPDTRLLFSLT